MDRRFAALVATNMVLASVVVYQSFRLDRVNEELRAERAKPYWPRRPDPIGLEAEPAQKFKPSVRKTIPEVFWGEFAEDVHDCATDRSIIITERKIMVSEDDRQNIVTVTWKASRQLEISAVGSDGISYGFTLELSPDGNEITFVYTNRKRLFQRCSARAHDAPDELPPIAENLTLNSDADLELAE